MNPQTWEVLQGPGLPCGAGAQPHGTAGAPAAGSGGQVLPSWAFSVVRIFPSKSAPPLVGTGREGEGWSEGESRKRR